MTAEDEELPQGEPYLERAPVDPFQELCALLRQPSSNFAPFNDLMLCARDIILEDGWESPDQQWNAVKAVFYQEVSDITQFLLGLRAFKRRLQIL